MPSFNFKNHSLQTLSSHKAGAETETGTAGISENIKGTTPIIGRHIARTVVTMKMSLILFLITIKPTTGPNPVPEILH